MKGETKLKSKFIKGTFLVAALIGIGTSSLVYADSQHLFSGGYPTSVVKDLRYIVSGGTSSFQTNVMKPAPLWWNGVSSNVKLSYTSTSAKLSLIVDEDGNGYTGYMFPYYQNAVGGLSLDEECDDVWFVTDCYGYTTEWTDAGYNDTNKKNTYAHEVGHALSMAHTTETAVMRTGQKSFSGLQTADKSHLKLKWGN